MPRPAPCWRAAGCLAPSWSRPSRDGPTSGTDRCKQRLTIAICAVGTSALITLRVLTPRLRTGEARSLLYFDHVARRYGGDRQAFVARYLRLGEDEQALCEQLVEQLWANSLVARRKFRRVAFGIYALGLAMLAAGAAVVVGRL